MENITDSGIGIFCDSMISIYFEYSFGNETYNIISRCSKENIQKFYDFCVELFYSFRGWNELSAYIFYMLFQHIFQYIDNYINGRSKIRMMMIGGHDVTVAPLMDFLSGFNYCGIPSNLNNTNNATNQTINNQTIKNETKIENVKIETNNIVNNKTVKNENVKNQTNLTINNQTGKNESKIENIKNVTQKESQSLNNSTKEKESEAEIVDILENNPNKNLSNMTKNRTNLLNNNNTLIKENEEKVSGKNFYKNHSTISLKKIRIFIL